eukprot:3658366-Pyramimonas_sp.AAC.1
MRTALGEELLTENSTRLMTNSPYIVWRPSMMRQGQRRRIDLLGGADRQDQEHTRTDSVELYKSWLTK